MNFEQSDVFYLKLKIKEQQNSLHFKDQGQDITSIRVIKQKIIDQQEKNQNIQNLVQAISKLYYAMYQIKDKRNLIMIHTGNIDFEKQKQFLDAIKTLIDQKQDFIQQLCQNEQKKYMNANNWTNNILSQQNEFFDFFYQISQASHQIKRQFFEQNKNHLMILQQNQNENFNKFLFTFCFIQNIKLEYEQDQEQKQEQSMFTSQSQNIDKDQNNENKEQYDHREMRNLYISISSDIKQQDIDFWSIYMKDYKDKNHLLILHPLDQSSNKKMNLKDSKLKNNTKNEFIAPIIYSNKIEYYQMKMIYKSILDQQIYNLNPDCIYLEYLLSQEFKLDLKALEYLIRQLQKRAKLIIHFRISLKEKFSEYELFNNLNAIVMGLQGFKNQEKTFLREIEYENIVNWTFQMISIYEKSNRNINISLQSEMQLMQIQVQNLKKIFGCLSNQYKFQWIENDNFQSQIYQHLVFRDAIILYDKINGDIFYYNRKLRNSDSFHLQINFKKIYLKQGLIEPSIIVLQNYLLIIYGYFKNNQFSNQILVFDLQNQCQNSITMNRDEEYAQFKHTYYENQSCEAIVNRIKNRRGPQICNNNFFDENNKNYMSFILIGGEGRESNVIMNIIEVVILDLRNQKFCSFIINKSQLCKSSSLKPWPFQMVLEGKQNCICFYLVLNGNQTNKLNYFSFPKNPQYLKQAQLLVQQQNSFQLFILPITLMQELIVQIDQLFDDCKCQYFDEMQSEENCFVWKILITRFVLFHHSIINHPIFARFQNRLILLQNNKFLQICFQIKIKLFLQVQDQNSQNYSDSRVEIDCKILEVLQQNND
ncbi:unnamed protein product [Paramecium sonneborni]|uniref:Uncharacterized protein n=1 Tax=Paramecium sonneborni TaxID=65129 RepID=A0A8S1LMC0_9CILI|nr:unnamed protein product [Paramecium sonneborni]